MATKSDARVAAETLRGMNLTENMTESCDSKSCNHVVAWHTSGDGVYCDECAAKQIKYAFEYDVAGYEKSQADAIKRAERDFPQTTEPPTEDEIIAHRAKIGR